MKKKTFKIQSLLLLITATLFFSCMRIDEDAIIGSWSCVKDYYHTDRETIWIRNTENEYTDQIVTFKADGTWTASCSGLMTSGKKEGSWAIIDKNLYINGTNTKWDIQKLTKTSLKILYAGTNFIIYYHNPETGEETGEDTPYENYREFKR